MLRLLISCHKSFGMNLVPRLHSLMSLNERRYTTVGWLDLEIRTQNFLLICRHADEHVDVYVVLSSPYHNEEQFRRLLSRVSITLEAYAAATRPWPNTDRRHDPSSTVLKDLIYRETCGGLDESLLVFGQDRADGDDKNLVSLSAAWRFTVLLGILSPYLSRVGDQLLKVGHRVNITIHLLHWSPVQIPEPLARCMQQLRRPTCFQVWRLQASIFSNPFTVIRLWGGPNHTFRPPESPVWFLLHIFRLSLNALRAYRGKHTGQRRRLNFRFDIPRSRCLPRSLRFWPPLSLK